MSSVTTENISKNSFRFHISDNSADDLLIKMETARLYIRSYQAEDLDNSAKLYGDPDLTKLFDHGKPRSREEVAQLVNDWGCRFFRERQPFGLFSIFEKNNQKFLGHIDLLPSEEPGVLEVGAILTSEAQGQGYCQEALRAVIFDFVQELKQRGHHIIGVMATAHPKNIASIKNIEKAGMVFQHSFQRFGNPRNQYFISSNHNPDSIAHSKL